MKTRYNPLVILIFVFTFLILALHVNAQAIRQNPWTTNATGAAFDAQGNDIRNLFKVGLTNGWLTIQTNSQRTFGGGTNDNRGVASVLIGSVTSTNGANILTSPNSLLIGAAGGASDRFMTNTITASGMANVMQVDNRASAAGNTTNVYEITGTSAASTLRGVNPSGRGGDSGINRFKMNNGFASSLSGYAQTQQDTLADEVNAANIVIYSSNGSSNRFPNLLGATVAGGASNYTTNNVGNSAGLVSAFRSDNGARTVVGSSDGSIFSGYADGGTNEMQANGAIMAGYADGASRIRHAGAGGILAARATSGTVIHSAAGGLLVVNTTTYGSASVSGNGASLIGSGTNNFPFSQALGYQPAGEQPRLMVRTNAVGVLTNTPQATLDVNGSAQSHFGFLSLLTSQTLAVPATTYTQITNYQASTVYGFGSSGTGNTGGSLTNTVAGYYRIGFQISFTGGNNDAFEIGVFTNLTECTLIETERTMGAAAAIGSASAEGIVYLPAGTRVDLRIQNTTDADDPTLERVQLVVGHP